MDLVSSDFGLSCELEQAEFDRPGCGSPIYIAPEILLPNPQWTFSVDNFAAGVCLYSMLFFTPPFNHHKSKRNGFKWDWHFDVPQLVQEDDLKDLFAGLLNKDPRKRLTPTQILQHPWMTRMDSKYMEWKKKETLHQYHVSINKRKDLQLEKPLSLSAFLEIHYTWHVYKGPVRKSQRKLKRTPSLISTSLISTTQC